MRSVCSILTIVMLTFPTASAVQSTWLSRPGTIRRCVGDDATFTWVFNSTNEVSTIFFTNAATKQTISAYYYVDGYYKEYDGYTGRTSIPIHDQSTVSVVLKAVTEADTAEYMIELAGPGLRDNTRMSVYEVDDLHPAIKLDNSVIEPPSMVNKSKSEDVIISVLTSDRLPAIIEITRDVDDFLHRCTNTSSCVCALSPSNQQASTVHIQTGYDICAPINSSFRIAWADSELAGTPDPPGDTEPNSQSMTTIAIVIVVLLSLTCVAMALTFVILRRKPYSELTKHDKTYLAVISCTRYKSDSNPGQPVDAHEDNVKTNIQGGLPETPDATNSTHATRENVVETSPDLNQQKNHVDTDDKEALLKVQDQVQKPNFVVARPHKEDFNVDVEDQDTATTPTTENGRSPVDPCEIASLLDGVNKLTIHHPTDKLANGAENDKTESADAREAPAETTCLSFGPAESKQPIIKPSKFAAKDAPQIGAGRSSGSDDKATVNNVAQSDTVDVDGLAALLGGMNLYNNESSDNHRNQATPSTHLMIHGHEDLEHRGVICESKQSQ